MGEWENGGPAPARRLPFSHYPILPFSHSPILPFSRSPSRHRGRSMIPRDQPTRFPVAVCLAAALALVPLAATVSQAAKPTQKQKLHTLRARLHNVRVAHKLIMEKIRGTKTAQVR